MSELGKRLVLSEQVEMAVFEAKPVAIISSFLESFDSGGRQTLDVPRHVMEALAQRLRVFMSKESKTLDAAFGNKTAWQRNAINRAADIGGEVKWAVVAERDAIKSQSRDEMEPGTLTEIAFERVAERLGMSPETVRKIYYE